MKEKIITARIKLQERNPFFAYLSLFLRFIEDENKETMGVNIKGEIFYNPQFIKGLTDEDIIIIFNEMIRNIK